jgi:hypothetical protein
MRRRVGIPYTMAIAEQLTSRDWAILRTLHRCRLVTGRQLQRLHFAHLSPNSQTARRSRVLARLVRLRVIAVAERPAIRLGGGSASPLYFLDTAGATLLSILTDPKGTREQTVRRPGLPGDRFTAHMLTVTELYVQAVEAERAGRFALGAFAAEPASWWTSSDGMTLKPDAYLRAERGDISDRWWVEIDLGTESIPTVAAKLRRYTRFAETGGRGPGGVLPAVLITTPGDQRARAIQTRAIADTDAGEFHVTAFRDAIDAIATAITLQD